MSEHDENEFENEIEDSAPSVNRRDGKSKQAQIIAFGAFVLVSMTLLFMFTGGDKEEKKASLVDQKTEDYSQAPKVETITLPEVEDIPIEIPEDEKPKEQIVISSEPSKPELTPEQRQAIENEKRLKEQRLRSNIVIFNASSKESKEQRAITANNERKLAFMAESEKQKREQLANLGAGGFGQQVNPNENLGSLLRTTETTPVHATVMRDRPFVIGEGKTLDAILESAVQSDLAGRVRALISHDIYSEDGKLLLLEKGSRLVGEYRGGVQQGQTRVFIVWNRVITPFGVDVRLDSPSTGTLGETGVGGWVDTHFLERFGSSMLLSVIGAYTAGDTQDNRNIELGKNFNRSAEIALENSINIKPTIHLNQGTQIKVFVNQDLNFKGAYELRRKHTK